MPNDTDSKNTLMPEVVGGSAADDRQTSGWTLPPDLLGEAVRRIRAVALVYATGYFIAGPLPALLIPDVRTIYFAESHHWLPALASIAVALLVVAIVSAAGIAPRTKIAVGLAFEVLGSIGIAAAEYHSVVAPIQYAGGEGGYGLSWVGPWVLLFSVVVPTPPRITMPAAVMSVAAVPLIYAAGVAFGSNVARHPLQFFLELVVPYLVILLMVYVGSRVVYGLGAAVREAREMGSYRLIEPLGKGGMGEVWRAQHRLLARPAAIKLIRPERLGVSRDQSWLMIRRFEREAQATALMRSPHTLELYDFGVAADRTFYYVMELLDGFDLDELVERFGPVPPERAVHFIRQICDSLGEAHAAGLIHRDIKPANVYTCRYGRKVDFIKVLDFGLVRHVGVERGSDKLTAEHTAGGTPAYMSPEQAVADEELDARSDLYSVGCVAYWLLTGTAVFKGRTPMETMMMHVHTAPEPPSSRIGSIPSALEAVVLACLDKDPDRRPQSADELAARLAHAMPGREWSPERARGWWDSNRPAIARIPLPSS